MPRSLSAAALSSETALVFANVFPLIIVKKGGPRNGRATSELVVCGAATIRDPSISCTNQLRSIEEPTEINMRTSIILLSLTALLAVAGCETIQGAGRDLSTVGEAVTAQSQEVQEEM